MGCGSIKDRLHISTIDADARELALKNGVGLEIADFCWAMYMDCGRESHIAASAEKARGIDSKWFHAPFAELAACAIDPKVLELTRERYLDSISIAAQLGINRVVIHGGYIPYVYFPEHYVEQSVEFWRTLLPRLPENIVIALENVMEPDPTMLIRIVEGVGDDRMGLCFDAGHANCEISSMLPMEWIDPMAPYLKHVHLHNNLGKKDMHASLNEGTIPMEALIDRIVSLAPNATFTIENQHSLHSLEWLASLGYI